MTGRRALAILGGAILALAIAPRPGSARAGPVTENVLKLPLWDDGKAEFAIYSGTTERYGESRPTGMHLIVVKEDVVGATLVKSDAGPIPGRTREAVKLNIVADFPTGTYTYHQMATLLFDRADMSVLKETMSHTEGCGITFVRIGPKQGRWVHEAHSYWDGEADRETPLVWPPGERVFADALPVWLRRFCAHPAPFALPIQLLPSQIMGRSPIANTRPISATVRLAERETLVVPAGRFDAVRFEVVAAGSTDRYWFDTKPPYVLLRVETAAGRKLQLEKLMRLDYWNHHAVGDEKLLE